MRIIQFKIRINKWYLVWCSGIQYFAYFNISQKMHAWAKTFRRSRGAGCDWIPTVRYVWYVSKSVVVKGLMTRIPAVPDRRLHSRVAGWCKISSETREQSGSEWDDGVGRRKRNGHGAMWRVLEVRPMQSTGVNRCRLAEGRAGERVRYNDPEGAYVRAASAKCKVKICRERTWAGISLLHYRRITAPAARPRRGNPVARARPRQRRDAR